jgi:uncharacterized protein YndB with AHSA1/START domain
MKTSDDPIVVEQTYNAGVDRVWKSITDIDMMRQWYFDNIPDFVPMVGFETNFMIHNEGRDFLHMWNVTEVVPRNKISYDWRFKDYPGQSSSTFELFEKGTSTTLRVTVIVRRDFPDDVPEFRRESCIGGWKYFLGERLKLFLDEKR